MSVLSIARCAVVLCCAASFAVPAAAQDDATAAAVSAPACTSEQLSLGTDDEHGAFDATSHGGTLLVVRNVSSAACRIPPFAQIVFRDRNGKALDIAIQRITPFSVPVIDGGKKLPMGPGPVVLPIALAAGAEATSALRWVDGSVYDHTVCVNPATVALAIGSRFAQTTMRAHVCGPDAAHLHVEAHRLALDPTDAGS